MEKSTYIFIGIIVLLAVSSYFTSEAFTDASGAKDSSGGYVTVSISDLLALLTTKQTPPSQPVTQSQAPVASVTEPSFEQQFSSLKGSIMNDVRQTLRNELQSKTEGSVMNDSCIDSVVNQQGNEWMRYIPGKNPADYIRKDSIPCYACNLN
jgi:hypothetical protein